MIFRTFNKVGGEDLKNEVMKSINRPLQTLVYVFFSNFTISALLLLYNVSERCMKFCILH